MPPVVVSVAEVPAQILTPAPVLIDGNGLIVTVTLDVSLHPDAFVPVTVYVVVIVGMAVTLAPVDADKPAAGDHE